MGDRAKHEEPGNGEAESGEAESGEIVLRFVTICLDGVPHAVDDGDVLTAQLTSLLPLLVVVMEKWLRLLLKWVEMMSWRLVLALRHMWLRQKRRCIHKTPQVVVHRANRDWSESRIAAEWRRGTNGHAHVHPDVAYPKAHVAHTMKISQRWVLKHSHS